MLDQLSPLTMIQVDFIQMNDYPADSCAVSPTAFLLQIQNIAGHLFTIWHYGTMMCLKFAFTILSRSQNIQ